MALAAAGGARAIDTNRRLRLLGIENAGRNVSVDFIRGTCLAYLYWSGRLPEGIALRGNVIRPNMVAGVEKGLDLPVRNA